ncbi:MAG: insulinase family protein [Acidobacteria bacterium]|nr:insulinase family protein [Acidobacteriota bacterium]
MKTALLLAAATFTLQAADVNVPFEKYKLPNGMRVILSRDSSVPVVAIYLVYGVGARSEEKGRTGFAHLFEHMMFQGSANAPKGMHFKLVESNGGNLNGSTHPDFTDYFEVLPSNKLAVGLWLEADRMRNLAITDENLTNQKEAVKQERRLSFDNRPYNTAIVDRWPELAFRNWQSSHSLIGSFEDLNAASVADVSKFFKTYYAPNNAVLAVVGDINTSEAKKWIETYFAGIPAQPQPKHPDMSEPAKVEPKTEVYKDALAQVPMVILGYPGPARRSPDYYALVILDVLLTGGESSRFQQNLVKGKQSVISYEANLGWPFAGPSDYKDPGHWAASLMYKPNFKGAQIVDRVQGEIDKIQKEGVPPAELERAKTFLRAARVRELQTSLNRAQLLAQYELFDGDPNLLVSELDKFAAVTPQQIQAVAKKYLTPDRRSVLDIQPAPKTSSAAPTQGGK